MTPQSVKDALADAQTLRNFWRLEARGMLPVDAAYIADGGGYFPRQPLHCAAELAARAAFLALPGLRGSK